MASKQDSTKVMWRVQYRLSRKHAWRQYATYETRKAARDQAFYMRLGRLRNGQIVPGSAFGFGNTRVVRHVRGGGR